MFISKPRLPVHRWATGQVKLPHDLSIKNLQAIRKSWGAEALKDVSHQMAKHLANPEREGLGIEPKFDVKIRLSDQFSLQGSRFYDGRSQRKAVATRFMQEISASLAKDFHEGFGGRVRVKKGGIDADKAELTLQFSSLGFPRNDLTLSKNELKTVDDHAQSLMGFVQMAVQYFRRDPHAFARDSWTNPLSLVPHQLTRRAAPSDFAREILMKQEIRSELRKLMDKSGIDGVIQSRPEYPGFGLPPKRDVTRVFIRSYPRD